MNNRRIKDLASAFNFIFASVYPEDELNIIKSARVMAVMVQGMKAEEAKELIIQVIVRKGEEIGIYKTHKSRYGAYGGFVYEIFKGLQEFTDITNPALFKLLKEGITHEDYLRIEQLKIEADNSRRLSYKAIVEKTGISLNTLKKYIRQMKIDVIEEGRSKYILEKDLQKIAKYRQK